MAEYIEKEATLRDICNDMCGVDFCGICENCRVVALIADTPPADVAPVRHGRWINWGDGVCCSVCESERPTKASDHKLSPKEVNFCYYCGAKMGLEADHG